MGTRISGILPIVTRALDPYVVREQYSETPGALPDAILELVDNKAYLPRHKKLQREHGNKILLKLAELAASKGKPSRWYATVTSVDNWPRTLEMIKSVLAATRRAVVAMEKLGADPKWLNWYVGQARKHSEAKFASWVERAQRARDAPRLFAWLSNSDGSSV